jgi:hypothetical protein
VAVLSDVLYWVLALGRWTLLGYLFGISFAILRGHTGLWKGCAYLAVLVVPSLIALLTDRLDVAGWATDTARLVAFCLPLGMAADYRTFRTEDLGWMQLRDLYHLSFLVGWGTAVTAAVGAALAAATQGVFGTLIEQVTTPTQVGAPSPVPTAPATSGPAASPTGGG